MVYARVGLLRTLPPPRPARRPAPAPHRPRAAHRLAGRAALPRLHPRPRLPQARRGRDDHRLHPAAARQRVRRASTARCPADPIHAALASEYAHVTAPLRRLGDRYAGEICVALCAGTDVPDLGARRSSHELPEVMKDAGRRAAPVRGDGARPGRGRRPPAPGGGDLRGRRRRRRREGRHPRHGHRSRSPPSRPA